MENFGDMMTAADGSWRRNALRGLAAVAFGVLALIWPGLTLLVLVLLFGAYALFDGVTLISSVFTSASDEPTQAKTVLAVRGAVGVVAGLVTFLWPGITALALLFVIAAWAVVNGVLEIAAAIRLRKEMKHEWLLVATGILSIVFGVLLAITPGAGALAITWLIGWFAILSGSLRLALAWRLHHMEHEGHLHGPISAAPV
ncbi:MAG: hypothetical protein JWM47_3006 [Acidimicrobiales bacterium]|nr:hypothetical protein [Acidimicrobiales bacterium]